MDSKSEITICLGSSCFSRGNKEVLQVIKKFLEEHNLVDQVFFHGDLCGGRCAEGPVLKIDNTLYSKVSVDNVYEILRSYFDINDNL
ncbi:(2Fe-2S) ferredoxin domain-containing protein [Carboxylicivirga linearis]|uniref:(2Fe-2S) ferredoxin domain-containing protein n=1 Tax=Carboxylicivirga linearis TaxID=1628157 RepID=A0ABS5JZ93_9BACT|nr:(2Fe-2S) ferredoxin domain-containing protein [Carboxylicivirga linearis]MBS2100159.1 (2Fe-2S) ferredoxin domain-containing protein [Carboxylicivirga linearis]